MERLWRRFAFISISILMSSCSRPLSEDISKITIDLPEAHSKSVGGLSALPANRKACFGISVTGPGITSQKGNSCSPTTGVLAGFAESGQVIEASVPKGKDRKIELYVFLQDVGQDVPCSKLSSSFSTSQILNTYLVATKSGLDFSADVVAVEITMSFPGESQHLAQQLALPAVCTSTANTNNPTGFGVTAARGTVSGTGINLHGRVGTMVENTVLTGGSIKLYVRE